MTKTAKPPDPPPEPQHHIEHILSDMSGLSFDLKVVTHDGKIAEEDYDFIIDMLELVKRRLTRCVARTTPDPPDEKQEVIQQLIASLENCLLAAGKPMFDADLLNRTALVEHAKQLFPETPEPIPPEPTSPEPTPHEMFHKLWTACVDKPGYNKAVWRAIEDQLKAAGLLT